VEAVKEEIGPSPGNGVSPLPCKLLPEHYFGFREVYIEVGDLLQGELAGNNFQAR